MVFLFLEQTWPAETQVPTWAADTQASPSWLESPGAQPWALAITWEVSGRVLSISVRGEGFLNTPTSPVSALLCETAGLSPPWACFLGRELLALGCFLHEAPRCWTQFGVAARLLRALPPHLGNLTLFQDGGHHMRTS